MVFPIDLTQWRVYSAEQSLPPGQEFESLEEASTYLWWVQSTKWWKTVFPDAPRITVRLGGNTNGTGELQSYARAIADDEWEISLHTRMMNAIVLLHEVAHCIAPRKRGDIAQLRRDRLSYGSHHHHGPYFRSAFASLAERYKVGVDPHELRRAYEHFELDTPDLDDLMAARAHSSEVELAVAEMWRRADDRWATNPEREIRRTETSAGSEVSSASDEPASPRILAEWWGDWLWLSRKHLSPRISQKRLAEEVSPIVKCSARDVARLERLREAPGTLIDRQRCLAFVAVMELDPVWAETHKNLAAGENTITLDALEAVAAEWVANVRHLNALLDARPPRWAAE
ncbi:MAG TPA: hypothetical protein VN108_05020, partial [Marmoricola sp.]|nr:hypothetical protein [Marmoricola sp.]